MKFTKVQIEKAKNCKTVEEFKVLAKNEGLKLTEEEAKMYFQATRVGELNDDDLDKVAGGAKASWVYMGSTLDKIKCPFCSAESIIEVKKYKKSIIDDKSDYKYEYSPNRCPCGAEIRFFCSTHNYDFVKNGEVRDPIRLGR